MRSRILAILLAAVCVSCSVKEERSRCLCRLEVDLSAFAKVTGKVSVEFGEGVCTMALSSGDSLSAFFSVSRRERFDVKVWSGVSRMRERSGVLSVPEGEDSDSLFLFRASVPGTEEQIGVRAIPHKQFAGVLLRVSRTDSPIIGFTVRSDYAGIDTWSGAAVPGILSIPLYGGVGDHSFRLPRQAPGSEIVLEAEGSDGKVKTYPLGEWILCSGYDWEAQDLDDIVIGADFAAAQFSISVVDWTAGSGLEAFL